ncbi:MAG: endopeptidase La [Acidimicrobiia bacterium]
MADVHTDRPSGRTVLPLLPLTSGVVLPDTTVTLVLESEEARAAARAALDADRLLLLVPRIDGVYARVGTVARLEDSGELPNGAQAVILRGLHRAALGAGVAGGSPGLWIEARPLEDAASARAGDLARELRSVATVLAERRRSRRLPEILRAAGDASALADGFVAWSDVPTERKVELLETTGVEARTELALEWARELLGQAELDERIRTEVDAGMEARQREFLLRRQLAAIRKELGEGEGELVEQYRERVAALALPADTRAAVERELDRFERTNEQSPEHGWIRTWLDTVLELPWGTYSDDELDVARAREVLDADHTGLDDVKDRVVEYLAVRKLRQERAAPSAAARESELTGGGERASTAEPSDRGPGIPPRSERSNRGEPSDRGPGIPARSERSNRDRDGSVILALVGPPGVGKTSLGESIARAMGRTFVRVALGGVRDEAEIRGHRRTYVGALPGRIVRAIKDAGTMNPVVLLDEVDKLGADWRGDPSSALLEVLDPAQNHTFRDHYLEVELDLSNVLFLATANVADTIPAPLLDRLEVVRLDGYTEDEKVAIARDHLLVRQRERNGLEPGEVHVSDAALRRVVEDYTREAGVRNLERELGRMLRKVAAKIAAGNSEMPVTLDADDVRVLLGRPRFFRETVDRLGVPGVATGLAVTGTGGDILFVEAGVMDGDAGLTLTGQLGDVMKESAQLALSYVRSHAPELGVDDSFAGKRIHLHVPAGAIPKDGPSAGVTMTTALVSLLSGRAVRPEVGMTGEVTLQGRVLPIGGLKQKVLAAERAGLTTVVLPARNEPDLDEVPEAVRARMTFHAVEDVRDVLALALEPAGRATPDAA